MNIKLLERLFNKEYKSLLFSIAKKEKQELSNKFSPIKIDNCKPTFVITPRVPFQFKTNPHY